MFDKKNKPVFAGAFRAIITCFLCLATTRGIASVVYTDIPDLVMTTIDSLDIDLDDSGGTSDISIDHVNTSFNPTSGGFYTSVYTWVEVKGAVWGPYNYFYAPLNAGALIDASTVGTACDPADKKCGLSLTEWADSGMYYAHWESLGPRYLGFAALLGTEIHYGWIQMSVASYDEQFALTIYDYAYESTPGTGILAGATGVSAVPLPGALLLFGSGLLALFGLRVASPISSLT